MAEDMTYREYWDEVASLARSITKETLADLPKDTQAKVCEKGFDAVDDARDALSERLHETMKETEEAEA